MLVGSKSAIHTNTMVNFKTGTDNGNLEVLQQSQMQNEAMASQSSCQTKSSLPEVICSFFSFLKQISIFDIVLCLNPARFEHYLCIDKYNTVSVIAGILCNTYISGGDSNCLLELTVSSLMNCIHCKHCLFIILSESCFV